MPEEHTDQLSSQHGSRDHVEAKRPAQRLFGDFRATQKTKQTPPVEVRLRLIGPDKIELVLIRTARTFRDQGYGSWTLRLLCLLADKYGVTLIADVCPADDHGLGFGELMDWYREHSFVEDDEEDDDSWMTRIPKAIAADCPR